MYRYQSEHLFHEVMTQHEVYGRMLESVERIKLVVIQAEIHVTPPIIKAVEKGIFVSDYALRQCNTIVRFKNRVVWD